MVNQAKCLIQVQCIWGLQVLVHLELAGELSFYNIISNVLKFCVNAGIERQDRLVVGDGRY
jgi:hypothetical protein